jgi:hypothetical protein
MKMAVFWVVASCSLVEFYRRFRGTICPHSPDDGGSKTVEKELLNKLRNRHKYKITKSITSKQKRTLLQTCTF